MTHSRTKNAPFSIKQPTRRDRGLPTGVRTHWWVALLSLAACGGGGGIGGGRAPIAPTTNDLDPGVIPFQDAIVSGNAAIVELDGEFPSGSKLTASLGSIGQDNKLTLSDAVFTEGTHTITITATDADGETVEDIVELVSDKTPTIATGLAEEIVVDAGTATVIDLAGVFGGGSGELTITGSFGTIDQDNKLSISETDLTDPTHTLTITATDADGDAVEETVEFATDKILVVANAVQDATVAGNDTTIDLTTVFDNDGDTFTLAASFGTLGADNMLTLSDADFTDGTHTITITATSDTEVAKQIFVLVSDKTPTIATAVAAVSIDGNGGTAIVLTNAFAGGSGMLAYKTTYNGSEISATGNTLTLADGAGFAGGANIITVTATDPDGDTVTMDITINANKSPTVNTGAEIADATIDGNDTTIDLDGVFGNAGGDLTLTASLGTIAADKLTLSDAVFTEGTHIITITATDADGETVEDIFELVSDKTPTIVNGLESVITVTGTTVIDLAGVFGGGSDPLTLTASLGTITDNKLAISIDAETPNTFTATVTATDADGDTVEEVVKFVIVNNLVIANAVPDTTVVGNDTTIDLTTVFDNGTETYTIDTTFGDLGADNKLTLSDAVLTEGIHTITITATDPDGDTVEDIFELVSDKTPTIVTAIADATVAGNDTTINLAGVFDGGSGALTLAASLGTVGTDNMLTLSDAVFTEGIHTITVTATDPDGDAVENVFELVSDKTPTIATAVTAVSIDGNGGTAIVLSSAFAGGSGTLTYKTTYNGSEITATGTTLTLPDGAGLVDGANTIIVTATDPDGDTVTMDITINADKSPTIATGLADEIAVSKGVETVVNLAGVFGGGSDPLTLTASLGTIADKKLTISIDAAETSSTFTVTVTATDFNNDTVEEVVEFVTDKNLVIANAVPDTTVVGNDTTIDLTSVFNGIDPFTISATLNGSSIAVGSDKKLTLSDTVLTEGIHTITITATDGSNTVEDIFELVSDKTPTIVTAIADATVAGNDTTINLAGVFDGGSGALTLAASLGTVGTDKMLTLSDAVFTDGTHTITVTATDPDDDTVEEIFVLISDKTPTIATAVTAVSIAGNDGTAIVLSSAFAGGSGTLTYKTTYNGSEINATGTTLTLPDGTGLVDGANTIIVTATDPDGDTVTMDITINANKSPTIANAVIDVNINSNLGTIIDLSEVFGGGSGDLTLTTATAGALGKDNHLTLYGYDLVDGVNALAVTATDADGDTVTDAFNITTTKTLATLDDAANNVYGATQHTTQTFNLARVFGIPAGTIFSASTLPGGVNLNGSTLSFDNAIIGTDTPVVTITASEGGDSVTHILTYTIDTIKDQSGVIGGTTYYGTTGIDMLTGNSFAATDLGSVVYLGGGAGNDTISNNTFTAESTSFLIVTLDGGDGNDTIANNNLTTTSNVSNFLKVLFNGGAGDDVFRNNTTTQTSLAPELILYAIDGGVGVDIVEFQVNASEYTGITDWLDGVTTITLSGNKDVVTVINVETIVFADGASYSAADAWAESNAGISYDLTNKFDGTFTAYSTDRGTITDSTLALAGTELAYENSFVVTATASDSNETTETITINALKTLKIVGAKQHAMQTIDLDAIFVDANTYTYTGSLPGDVSQNGSILSFDNTALSETDHKITITATDGSDMFIHTLTYALDTFQNQSITVSDFSQTGTTLADAIMGNSFAADNIYSITFDSHTGDDTINSNNITAGALLVEITFDGHTGNDTISSNSLTAGTNMRTINFDGDAGDDTISNNTLTANQNVRIITFDGGAGNDTISSNTLTANQNVRTITFDGGAGDDTISDNHFESTGTNQSNVVSLVTLRGGAGDDVFSGNTATQANGSRSSITIDGDAGTDKVYFELADTLFTIAGTYGSNITVTDKAARTETPDGVDSYAEYVLIDIEELYFDGTKYEFGS